MMERELYGFVMELDPEVLLERWWAIQADTPAIKTIIVRYVKEIKTIIILIIYAQKELIKLRKRSITFPYIKW